jgi:diazepam-binding inhibitor (GABA receptor modulating acyl-CoA-binding protein)
METILNEFEALLDQCKEGGSGRPLVDKQSTDVKLKLYGLGKQGKFGDCNDPKPGMFSIKEKAKWEAWNALKGTDQLKAKQEFIALAKKVLNK